MLKQPRLTMQEMWRTYCHQIRCSGDVAPAAEEHLAFWAGVSAVVAAMNPVDDQRPASLSEIRDDLRAYHARGKVATNA
jgi:hypothetical protein